MSLFVCIFVVYLISWIMVTRELVDGAKITTGYKCYTVGLVVYGLSLLFITYLAEKYTG